jgi:uncharacterized membrane protein YgcG
MPKLLRLVSEDAVLSHGLRAAHFLSVKDGSSVVVSLIYDTPLQDTWRAAAAALVATLACGVSVQGRSRGKQVIEGVEHVLERLLLPGVSPVFYRQVEGSFSNPNPAVNEKVLGWLCECASGIKAWEQHLRSRDPSRSRAAETLLELYCGNCNHTCALARCFRRVVAVEINPVLCQAAEYNLGLNGVTNTKVICSPSADVCSQVLRLKRLPSSVGEGKGGGGGGSGGGVGREGGAGGAAGGGGGRRGVEERGGREEQRVGGGEAEGGVVVDDDREHLYLGGTSAESAGRGVRSGEEGGTYVCICGDGGGDVIGKDDGKSEVVCINRERERLCVQRERDYACRERETMRVERERQRK